MTKIRRRGPIDEAACEAVVWIDRDQAVILGRAADGRNTVEHLDRSPAESEASFEFRTTGEIVDRGRVVVSGPGAARLEFERAYVAMTHRPDRLVDVEPTTPTSWTPRQSS